jgi:hypothetical protein
VFEARSNTGSIRRIIPGSIPLGTRDDLASLCESARRPGIGLLDGVIQPYGADRIFQPPKRYPEIGAYQEATGRGLSRTHPGNHPNKGGSLHLDSWGVPGRRRSARTLSYRAFIHGETGLSGSG